MTVYFDDSLPKLVEVIQSELGDDALRDGTVLRDAVGRLAFFAATSLEEPVIEALSKTLSKELGAYARTDRVLADANDYSATTIREDPSARSVMVNDVRIRLVDRRIVGADWLHTPSEPAPPPPRFVFASLKGGVGRSTALAVVAAHLASRGLRVLVVDLDMEAPGLGALLLNEGTLPEFGVIDALVENGLSGLDEQFYANLVGPSDLANKRGRIDVVPALGRRSTQNPADVLAKLARAYTEDVKPDGTVASILDQVRAIIDHLADPARYDAVLIDARAGIHETTASAILGLGAEVLLFGLDEPQTFQGYGVMLAYLARFLPPDAPTPEWVDRLTMVQGKAPLDADRREEFVERCRDLFAKAGFVTSRPTRKPAEESAPSGSFSEIPWNDDLEDEDVLPMENEMRPPRAVLYDEIFQGFNPISRRDQISENIYRNIFGDLLAQVDEVLQFAREDA